jgi:hypothetical protein
MQIVTNPITGWCPICHDSWRQDMIAIQIPTSKPFVICYACIAKAESLGAHEEQRRLEATQHGGKFS